MRLSKYYIKDGGDTYTIRKMRLPGKRGLFWRCTYVGTFSYGKFFPYPENVPYDYSSYEAIRQWIQPVTKKQLMAITIGYY